MVHIVFHPYGTERKPNVPPTRVQNDRELREHLKDRLMLLAIRMANHPRCKEVLHPKYIRWFLWEDDTVAGIRFSDNVYALPDASTVVMPSAVAPPSNAHASWEAVPVDVVKDIPFRDKPICPHEMRDLREAVEFGERLCRVFPISL